MKKYNYTFILNNIQFTAEATTLSEARKKVAGVIGKVLTKQAKYQFRDEISSWGTKRQFS